MLKGVVVICAVVIGGHLSVAADSGECIIPVLKHGDIKKSIMGDYYWNWQKFKYERQVKDIKIPPGTISLNGSAAILFCHKGYYPFKTPHNRSRGIICSKGKWLPYPACHDETIKDLESATFDEESSEDAVSTDTKLSKISEESSAGECIIPMLNHGEIKESRTGEYYWNWRKFKYERHVNYEKIAAGNISRHGTSLMLFCHSGYSFLGTSAKSREIACIKGKLYPYPLCLREKEKNIQPATWDKERIEATIEDIKPTESLKESNVVLKIHCPKIDGKGIFTIYSNNRIVNSTALFFCKAQHQKVLGSMSMTCQENGEWSGDYPTCVDITCSIFPKYNGLSVIYSKDRKVNGIATFSCSNHATLVGSTTATCLINGKWSHPEPPSCEKTKKDPQSLMMDKESREDDSGDIKLDEPLEDSNMNILCPLLNENNVFLITYSNNRKVNSVSSYRCINSRHRLIGFSKRICLHSGKWSGTEPECEGTFGCRVHKDGTSPLIVEPMKDSYRFGEFIDLSCPPGQKLTSEVQRMMCLGSTWSDTLPDCT